MMEHGMNSARGLSLTWLGFGGFSIRTPGGKTLMIDPWIKNNPACPPGFAEIDQCDLLFLTHAHRDHMEDAIWLAQRTGTQVLAGFELAQYLIRKGVRNVVAINKGGTRRFGEIAATAVHADHSSGIVDGDQILYGGEPMGYVIRFENGCVVYHAGDTNVFGDMALIAELYAPEVALLPIGDAYTMSPREAAKAVQLLNVREVVPTHFGVLDFLTGRPSELRTLTRDMGVTVYDLQPFETLLL
jgi:L-ascorbate metabolism protein UlaG (beta-lactamase superfamily)